MSKNTVTAEVKGTGLTSSTVRLEATRLPENKVFCLQRVTVTNLTSSGDIAKIGVKVGSNVLWLETIVLTTAGYYYALTQPVYINSCRSVFVDFVGTTTADLLETYVYGFYVD